MIVNAGDVVVTEDFISINNFDIADPSSQAGAAIEAIDWAIELLQKEKTEIFMKFTKGEPLGFSFEVVEELK